MNPFKQQSESGTPIQEYHSVKGAYSECYKLARNVNSFAGEMISRLIDVAPNRKGWDMRDFTAEIIIKRIRTCLKKMERGENQTVDIANYCMFLNYKFAERRTK